MQRNRKYKSFMDRMQLDSSKLYCCNAILIGTVGSEGKLSVAVSCSICSEWRARKDLSHATLTSAKATETSCTMVLLMTRVACESLGHAARVEWKCASWQTSVRVECDKSLRVQCTPHCPNCPLNRSVRSRTINIVRGPI